MNWDTTKDYMNSFLGILFLGLPLIGALLYERKKTIDKRKKKSLLGWIFAVILGCLFLTWLGVDKINRDKKHAVAEEISANESKEKIESLTTGVNKLDSIKKDYEEFMTNLKQQKHIERDSNNQPVQTIFNTNIKNAETVNIGK